VRRPADALSTWAGQVSQATGVPVVAVQAYGQAQLVLAADTPDCHLGWTTLAGIGQAASRHGQGDGRTLARDGRSSPPFIGSGTDDAGHLRPDTDAGRVDSDSTADRPVGPMQLLPGQWSTYASDGDQDGQSDPYDIDDASLATARLLCDRGANLSQPAQWSSAVARLRPGNDFTRAVFEAADGYGTRTRGAG
jgi:membrane-bound lytic murein transglycosylase B